MDPPQTVPSAGRECTGCGGSTDRIAGIVPWPRSACDAVGFSQRACLYQTLAGAVEHNYRTVVLREGTFSAEYPDTVDESLPEKGWLRKIMFRNFEHIIGYTASTPDFVAACKAIE